MTTTTLTPTKENAAPSLFGASHPYPIGTPVLIPSCAVYEGGIGTIKRWYWTRCPADRWDEARLDYDVELRGDIVWMTHHQIEEAVL